MPLRSILPLVRRSETALFKSLNCDNSRIRRGTPKVPSHVLAVKQGALVPVCAYRLESDWIHRSLTCLQTHPEGHIRTPDHLARTSATIAAACDGSLVEAADTLLFFVTVIVVVSRFRLLFVAGSSCGRVQISEWLLLLSLQFVVAAAFVFVAADCISRTSSSDLGF